VAEVANDADVAAIIATHNNAGPRRPERRAAATDWAGLSARPPLVRKKSTRVLARLSTSLTDYSILVGVGGNQLGLKMPYAKDCAGASAVQL